MPIDKHPIGLLLVFDPKLVAGPRISKALSCSSPLSLSLDSGEQVERQFMENDEIDQGSSR